MEEEGRFVEDGRRENLEHCVDQDAKKEVKDEERLC